MVFCLKFWVSSQLGSDIFVIILMIWAWSDHISLMDCGNSGFGSGGFRFLVKSSLGNG